jgi:hypothetical protein
MIEALCYKPEGLGLDSRWGHRIFNLPNPSSRNVAFGSTQPLTEISVAMRLTNFKTILILICNNDTNFNLRNK